MNRICILLLLLLATLNSFADDWNHEKISKLASISFPGEPGLIDTMGNQLYTFAEENVVYIVQVRDLTKVVPLDVTPSTLAQFYDEVVKGMMNGQNGQILAKKSFSKKGLQGIELEYTSTFNPNLPDLKFERLLFFNKTLFVIGFYTPSGTKELTRKNRERFFESFSLLVDSKTVKQYTKTDQQMNSYEIGEMVGRIIGFILIIGLFVGALVLIIRFIKKMGKRDPY